MPEVTTEGLVDSIDESTALQTAQWADAAGSADTITAAYDPAIEELTDGMILGFRASAANATNAPTFSPDSLTAHAIVRKGGSVLAPGDIPAADAEVLVRYNLANTRWELVNPYPHLEATATYAIAGGSPNAITGAFVPPRLTLEDGTRLYVRSTAAITSNTVTFSPDGLTARNIVRGDGTALQISDIVTGQDLILEYDLANTRWKLLNWQAYRGAFKRLIADDTGGQNVNTAQPWFPTNGAVTLPAGEYEFEGFLWLSRSAGTTSHTTAILFGGTATISVITYLAMCKEGDANDLQDMSGFASAAATALVVKAASTSATEQVLVRVTGTLTISVAGTIIPQFIYSAAPGGAPTAKAGTVFRITPRTNPAGLWA